MEAEDFDKSLSAEEKLKEKFKGKIFTRKEATEFLRSFTGVVWQEGVYRSEIVNRMAKEGKFVKVAHGKYQLAQTVPDLNPLV